MITLTTRWSLMSWLDRQRGTPKAQEKIPKPVALVGMGILCSLYTGHWFDWQAVVITITVAFSHNFGFGEPVGRALSGVTDRKYEPWQVGKTLKENPWIAVTVRGLFVGTWTLLALDPIASLKIAIAFGVAFPLASYVVRYRIKMPTRTITESGAAWARQEEIRGALIEALLILMLAATLIGGALY